MFYQGFMIELIENIMCSYECADWRPSCPLCVHCVVPREGASLLCFVGFITVEQIPAAKSSLTTAIENCH